MEDMKEKIRVRVVSTTNKNKRIKDEVGKVRLYSRLDGCAFLEYPGKPCYGTRTSLIVKETREGNTITIETQNSTYVLEVLGADE